MKRPASHRQSRCRQRLRIHRARALDWRRAVRAAAESGRGVVESTEARKMNTLAMNRPMGRESDLKRLATAAYRRMEPPAHGAHRRRVRRARLCAGRADVARVRHQRARRQPLGARRNAAARPADGQHRGRAAGAPGAFWRTISRRPRTGLRPMRSTPSRHSPRRHGLRVGAIEPASRRRRRAGRRARAQTARGRHVRRGAPLSGRARLAAASGRRGRGAVEARPEFARLRSDVARLRDAAGRRAARRDVDRRDVSVIDPFGKKGARGVRDGGRHAARRDAGRAATRDGASRDGGGRRRLRARADDRRRTARPRSRRVRSTSRAATASRARWRSRRIVRDGALDTSRRRTLAAGAILLCQALAAQSAVPPCRRCPTRCRRTSSLSIRACRRFRLSRRRSRRTPQRRIRAGSRRRKRPPRQRPRRRGLQRWKARRCRCRHSNA